MVVIGVSLQDETRKENRRGGDLAKAPVSQRHLGVFRLRKLLQRSHRRLYRIETPLTLNQQGDGPQSTQAEKQDVPGTGSAGCAGSADGAGGGNENLSSTRKLKNRARPLPERIFLLSDPAGF